MTAQTLFEAGQRAKDKHVGATLCQKAVIVAQREHGVSMLTSTLAQASMHAFNLQYHHENLAALEVVGRVA